MSNVAIFTQQLQELSKGMLFVAEAPLECCQIAGKQRPTCAIMVFNLHLACIYSFFSLSVDFCMNWVHESYNVNYYFVPVNPCSSRSHCYIQPMHPSQQQFQEECGQQLFSPVLVRIFGHHFKPTTPDSSFLHTEDPFALPTTPMMIFRWKQ